MNPVYENIVTGMPDFTDITYEFVLWTNFIEQMNPLVETFADHNNTYWGASEEYIGKVKTKKDKLKALRRRNGR